MSPCAGLMETEASSAFRPLPGVEVGRDDRGCLRIRGPMTLDQWVQTNDLVELQPDGSFRWLGRWDTIINTGGVKVQVEQVESALEEALRALGLGERRFFVGPLPDERLGQVVAAIVEGEPLGIEAETAIQLALRDRLDRFALPRRFVYLPSLAETPTGKIDRQANYGRCADLRTRTRGDRPGLDAVQRDRRRDQTAGSISPSGRMRTPARAVCKHPQARKPGGVPFL